MLDIGTNGNDHLIGLEENDRLLGGLGDDSLDGGGGNDVLFGEAGADTMSGSTGDDLCFVTDPQDVVVENAHEGEDGVFASVTYTLPSNVENLFLQGSGAIDGTGNDTANKIIGNSGRNAISGNDGRDWLEGRGGSDELFGGGGNDVLIWDAADSAVDGGDGYDRLGLAGSGVTLDLTTLPAAQIRDIESIVMTAGDHSLILSLASVLAISSTTNVLWIEGNLGDALRMIDDPGWPAQPNIHNTGNNYHVYTLGFAKLVVDTDIAVTQP